jgi:hypothetical protein
MVMIWRANLREEKLQFVCIIYTKVAKKKTQRENQLNTIAFALARSNK